MTEHAKLTGGICQLTSAHTLDDERILHRMAVTCSRLGYQTAVAGRANSSGEFEGIPLLAAVRAGGGIFYGRHIAWFWLFVWALRSPFRAFQIHDPDLIPTGLLLRVFRRKVIYDVHDDYQASVETKFSRYPLLDRIASAVWWFFEKSASRFFNGVIVADQHLSRKFASCDPVILGNYPNLDFTKRSDVSQECTFNVLYVGGVTQQRGVEVSLQAIQQLPHKDIRFHVVGPCPDRQLEERLAAEDRVILHGRVDWTNLSCHYERAHIGLAIYQPLPGFVTVDHSVKIVEYMAAGIPVVTSDFPGLRAFVADQSFGMVIDPTSTEALANTIDQLYRDTELRTRLGNRGRELFEAKFNWEKSEKKFQEFLNRTLC